MKGEVKLFALIDSLFYKELNRRVELIKLQFFKYRILDLVFEKFSYFLNSKNGL